MRLSPNSASARSLRGVTIPEAACRAVRRRACGTIAIKSAEIWVREDRYAHPVEIGAQAALTR